MTAYLSTTVKRREVEAAGSLAAARSAEFTFSPSSALPLPWSYWDTRASPLVNVHVRVMCRISVSRLMSCGNRANGDDISTIFTAAASRIRLPELRLTSMFSTLPSLLIDTVSSRLP